MSTSQGILSWPATSTALGDGTHVKTGEYYGHELFVNFFAVKLLFWFESMWIPYTQTGRSSLPGQVRLDLKCVSIPVMTSCSISTMEGISVISLPQGCLNSQGIMPYSGSLPAFTVLSSSCHNLNLVRTR